MRYCKSNTCRDRCPRPKPQQNILLQRPHSREAAPWPGFLKQLRRAGGTDHRKLLCRNDFSWSPGGPMPTECDQSLFEFETVAPRWLNSMVGRLHRAAVRCCQDKRAVVLTPRLARCLTDRRDRCQVEHGVATLVGQRLRHSATSTSTARRAAQGSGVCGAGRQAQTESAARLLSANAQSSGAQAEAKPMRTTARSTASASGGRARRSFCPLTRSAREALIHSRASRPWRRHRHRALPGERNCAAPGQATRQFRDLRQQAH
jgi:hypothetical protein